MRYCALALLLFAACKSEKVHVNVNCITTAAPAVECDVTQKQGKSEVEVCWDFTATCANGAVVTAARTCQKVKDGGTVKATIPADKLQGVEKCGGDKPPQASVTNMTLDGEKSQ